MKIKGVIFDLDGTLVNSIEDLADAMNSVLNKYNYPTHSYDDYEKFVGSGVRSLVYNALPENHNDAKMVNTAFNEMIAIYSKNCTNKTKPYNGIVELLEALKSRNIKLSVLSNKTDEYTKIIVDAILPNYFELVYGLRVEAEKKPNPIIATKICDLLGFKKEEMLFVGDSDVDMQTANNANIQAVGVLWGFRSKENLLSNGANHILNKPMDLLDIIS